MDGPIWNLAHQGWMAAYPENTLPAFCKALDTPGCHGLELDAQLTKDGALVVIHDETVDRTTNGTGPVKEHALEWYEDVADIPFEGRPFPAPRYYDAYLRYKFGDYMTLPPPEQRHWHPAAKFRLPEGFAATEEAP